jgi:hypothetical protein
MTGPDHYRQAERHARQAETLNDPAAALVAAQLATAHALLANAAATALIAPQGAGRSVDVQQWINAAGGGAR